MEQRHARPDLADEALPGFATLLEEPVPAPVEAVYEAAGSTIDDISRIQVTWWPGRYAVARYRIEGSGGDLAGRRDLVATVGSIPDGAAVVTGPDAEVGVWVVPNDPSLPGLASALDAPTVDRLLSDLGADGRVAHTRLRSYRPGRRAVVEISAGNTSIFLKVVPPADVEGLHERHRYLADALAIPDSLGLSRELGIVAMRALGGTDLRAVLRGGGAVPDPASIAGILEHLPAPRGDWEARSPIEVVPKLVDLLGRLVPDMSDRLDRLAAAIGEESVAERLPVHGDFHEAQILIDANRPIGLIDVDTYGWGRPGDDPATMLGHLHLLAPGCESPNTVINFAAALNRHWDSSVDPVDLRFRTAAVAVGLATGPFRVQRPGWPQETRDRIAAAEAWVESALRMDERSLIASSDGSHTAVG